MRQFGMNRPFMRSVQRVILATGIAQVALVTAALDAATNPLSNSTSDASVSSTQSLVTLSGKRNVLLIIADDVGVDQLPVYVNHFNDPVDGTTSNDLPMITTCTPTIDALARAGVTFVNAWGYPTCSPTRASLYTGTHAFRTGVYSPDYANDFSPSTTTIAEVLENAGYACGLLGKWHLGGDANGGYRPTSHGWRYHAGILGGGLTESYYKWDKVWSSRSLITNPVTGKTMIAIGSGETIDYPYYATWDTMMDAAWWSSTQTGRWMTTVAYNAAHLLGHGTDASFKGEPPPSTCVCTAVAKDAPDKKIYQGTVECLDTYIGGLLSMLSISELEKTTIIFIGDNGTEQSISTKFARNAYTDAKGNDVSHAKGSVYNGGLNIPFIIADGFAYLHGTANPSSFAGTGRVVSPDRTSTALVQTVDLFKTIAAIAGANGTSGIDAVSLIPLLENSETKVRDASYVTNENDEAVMAYEPVSFGKFTINILHKLVRRADQPDEVYNLFTDRWETANIAATVSSSILADLQAKLDTFRP